MKDKALIAAASASMLVVFFFGAWAIGGRAGGRATYMAAPRQDASAQSAPPRAAPTPGRRAPAGKHAQAHSQRRAAPCAVARRFYLSYLRFSYGQPGARIEDASRGLDRTIEATPPVVPASVRQRTAQIVELECEAEGTGRVSTLAAVDDGVLRYTLIAHVALVGAVARVVSFQPWG
ncbi:MAG: hypothetical protein ACYDA6_03195 [Solirubrobacteraceae bacterium]